MLGIDKVAFTIGSIEVRWYGIIIAFGALLAALLSTRVARQRGENPDHIWQVFPWALIGGIIGARLGFFISSPQDFKGWDSLNPLSGGFQGLSIQGAVVGGIIACWIYSRFSKLPLFRLMDIAAPGIALAQGIGRLGNYVNQEAYGSQCDDNNSLCVVIDNPPAPYKPGSRFQPTFAYEMVWDFMNAGVVYWLNQPRQQQRFGLRDGDVFWIYAIIYSIGRFIIESIRIDSAMAGGAKIPQLFAIATIVVAAAFIAYAHRTRGGAQLAGATVAGRNVTFTSGGKAVSATDNKAADEQPADEQAAEDISAEEDKEGAADPASAEDAVDDEAGREEEEAAASAAWTEPQIPPAMLITEPAGGTLDAAEVAAGQQMLGELEDTDKP